MAKPSLAVRLLARLLRPVVAEAMRQERQATEARCAGIRWGAPIDASAFLEEVVEAHRALRDMPR